MPRSDGRAGNKRSANQSGTPAWEALKNAVYFATERAEYAGRIGEHDDLINGGGAGALKYLEQTIDPARPYSAYWGDVLDAMRALELEARASVQVDGALW